VKVGDRIKVAREHPKYGDYGMFRQMGSTGTVVERLRRVGNQPWRFVAKFSTGQYFVPYVMADRIKAARR
jgi:hypothetical protein